MGVKSKLGREGSQDWKEERSARSSCSNNLDHSFFRNTCEYVSFHILVSSHIPPP